MCHLPELREPIPHVVEDLARGQGDPAIVQVDRVGGPR